MPRVQRRRLRPRDHGNVNYSPPSLYRIALEKCCSILRTGMWRTLSINPLKNMPVKLINEILEFTITHHNGNPPKIQDVELLLDSGCLTAFDLRPFNLKAEHNLNSSCEYHESLTTLHLVKKLIIQNRNLEEVHLKFIHLNLDIFKNCEKLRILRFYTPPLTFRTNYFNTEQLHLPSLNNVEVLYIPDMDTDHIVKVLQLYPKLMSLGSVDSLDAIYKISQMFSIFNYRAPFQLRRCIWGKNSNARCKTTSKLKIAVKFCPLLEELIIYISDKDALGMLSDLKKLTLLRIDFWACSPGFMPEFFQLLQKIGPQLVHLSIHTYHLLPADVISKFCPRLQSLEISGPIFVENHEDASNLPLKRLSLSYCLYDMIAEKEKGLQILVSKCKNLEELFLEEVYFLDDRLLIQILQENPLTKLRVMYMEKCYISKKVFAMFIRNATSIDKALICSEIEGKRHNLRKFYKDPNLYKKNVDLMSEEFFHCQLNESRF